MRLMSFVSQSQLLIIWSTAYIHHIYGPDILMLRRSKCINLFFARKSADWLAILILIFIWQLWKQILRCVFLGKAGKCHGHREFPHLRDDVGFIHGKVVWICHVRLMEHFVECHVFFRDFNVRLNAVNRKRKLEFFCCSEWTFAEWLCMA